MKRIIVAVVLVLACIVIFFLIKNGKDLQENGVLITGKVVNTRNASRGGLHIDYEYIVDEKVFDGSRLVFVPNGYANQFAGRIFPLLYSRVNPGRGMLLMIKADFTEYNLKQPDTLKWVDKLLY